ncbi:MAG: 4a-hydroxytetrahydrobiopterin dehydratase [Propionibacteriales bacterium]|nr:4a-hydroxytetrahydrobiopterin dehydratase [Propionibacteriales bacterium]
MADVLDDRQIHQAMSEHPHWESRDGALMRSVHAPDFIGGIRLVDEVAVVAEGLNHHPDIDIRWTTVTFHLSTHSEGGVTKHDVELAGRIDEIVDRLFG